jgi:hypothetical protein
MITPNEQDYFERMLAAQFKNIEDKVDHVIRLQQIANGRTSKNEERIEKNENRIDKLEGFWAESRGHWKAASVIGSLIGAALGILAAIIWK